MGRVRALVRRRDMGMTTAEYAIGVCGAGGFAGLLYKFLTSDWGPRLLETVAKRVLAVFGGG